MTDPAPPRRGAPARVDGPAAPPDVGAAGFPDDYWRETHGCLATLDGVANAAAHAAYLKGCFDVVLQPIDSIVDLGFGLARLTETVLRAFRPPRALGIEPSPSAYEAARGRDVAPEGTRLTLERIDLAAWCRRPTHPKLRFDLGVCTSVLQYLDDAELELVVPVLASRLSWLYVTVPTEAELDQQIRDEQFLDRWAIRRPKRFYVDLFRPHFTVVGARLLESRRNVPRKRSPFTDDLFRGWPG